MLLVLDIGNSQTSFGFFSEKKLLVHFRAQTAWLKTVDQVASFLLPLLSHHQLEPKKLTGVAICSVVPPVEAVISQFSEQYLEKEPFKVSARSCVGFTLNVDNPNEVGADRIANSAYAIENLKLPAVVIDLGTATTLDVITPDKCYQGGVILPGVAMGIESLSSKTSLLPLIEMVFPQQAVGKNTMTCIQSGTILGYCDALDGLLKRIQNELNQAVSVTLTGGIAPLFYGKLQTPHEYLPDLTLEGTLLLYQLNG